MFFQWDDNDDGRDEYDPPLPADEKGSDPVPFSDDMLLEAAARSHGSSEGLRLGGEPSRSSKRRSRETDGSGTSSNTTTDAFTNPSINTHGDRQSKERNGTGQTTYNQYNRRQTGGKRYRMNESLGSFQQANQANKSPHSNPHQANHLATLGNALESVIQKLRTQIQLARERDTAANVSTQGDSRARIEFYTLLSEELQRRAYLDVMTDSAAFPRARALFGAPPYAFLKPGDGDMLAASGFATSRVNMTYDNNAWNLSYSHFGLPHFVDQYMRQFRVIQHQCTLVDAVGPAYLFANSPSHVLLAVRIPKSTKAAKIEMAKDVATIRGTRFPTPGEVVALTVQAEVWSMVSVETRPGVLMVGVTRVVASTSGESTALLNVQLTRT